MTTQSTDQASATPATASRLAWTDGGAWADGGLATSLQARGLPSFTPVDAWLDSRPEAIRGVHQAFAAAGAKIVVAGTFALLPHQQPRWRALIPHAVQLAREGAPDAAIYASFGPLDTPTLRWSDADASTRDAWVLGLTRACQLAIDAGAAAIIFETYVDADALVSVVSAVRPTLRVPIVASLTPRADGSLWSGAEPKPALDSLIAAGADIVGFNCGSGPCNVANAIARVADFAHPLWAKPAGGGLDETVAALRALAARCAVVGGCCGVSPALLAEAIREHDR